MEPIRVLLADEKELFREGLVKLLEGQPQIQVVCQCDNGLAAVEKTKETRPDVVLIDAQIRGCDGFEATQRINESSPDTKVAVLTDSEDEEHLFSALKYGANGYLLKRIGLDGLVKSIDLIAKGEVIISPSLAGTFLNEFASMREEKESRRAQAQNNLSERETEVLNLVARGATNREIARELSVAEQTVKVHIKNILDKLQLRNKQQAAAYAVQHGLAAGVEGRE